MKRLLQLIISCFILSLVLFFDCAIGAAESSESPIRICVDTADTNEEDLFERYVETLFRMPDSVLIKINMDARSNLSIEAKALYDELKPLICKVAAGERTSTSFTVDHSVSLDNEELKRVLIALLSDCPYELYWFDKGYGFDVCSEEDHTVFQFAVAEDYSAGEYLVDTEKVDAANNAVRHVDEILARYADASDYEKLVGYKNEICNLVSYNYEAASGAPYGNAWQLIWVFDGDDATNVVCEGYSKAFQYLCDRTSFDGDVSCYTATGWFSYEDNDGSHMWNLVQMPNGKIYLADITNSDEGTVGADGQLFLAGCDYSDNNANYYYQCVQTSGVYSLLYQYDNSTMNNYPKQDLAVSVYSYQDEGFTPIQTGETAEFEYEIIGDEVTITRYKNTGAENVSIPKTIENLPVTEIGCYAFLNCSVPNTIHIPDSVKHIHAHAFNGCSVSSVQIEDGLVSIGYSAFSSCSLNSINIPSTVISIGRDAFLSSDLIHVSIPGSVNKIDTSVFSYCQNLISVEINNGTKSIGRGAFAYARKLSNVDLPDSIETIEGDAFKGCENLNNMIIPHTVKSIDYGVFAHCDSLQQICINGESEFYQSIDGVLFNGEKTILVTYPAGKEDESYTIPNGVTAIAPEAFSYCENLTSVIIPDSVEEFGYSVFENCLRLESVTLPAKFQFSGFISSIAALFENCESLGSINISSESENYCSINGVLFSKDQTVLIAYPAGRKDTSYIIPDSVEIIDMEAFRLSKNLESVTIPKSVKEIGPHAFQSCTNLKGIAIPDSIEYIGQNAFFECVSLEYANIPSGITSIEYAAFWHCESLNSITIPNTVTAIGEQAFMACESLTSIVIPDSVVSIGEAAFYMCYQLENITLPKNLKSIGNLVFCSCAAKTIRIPDGLKTIGKQAFGWNQIETVFFPNSVTIIESGAFTGNPITDVFYKGTPEQWNEIDIYTMNNENYEMMHSDLHFLENVLTLPHSLKTIDSEAFSEILCDGVIIPDGCTSIGSRAFADCPNLMYVQIPSSVTFIAPDAFEHSPVGFIERVE